MSTEIKVGTREEWRSARLALLEAEKELTRRGDELSRQRRALPWVPVETAYEFETPSGPASLADLFAGHSQLLVYHFMFGPDWEVGCKSCSFWADNFNSIVVHLNQRGVAFAAISRAPIPNLREFAQRMGWSFNWLSSQGNDFNFDYQVSFAPEDLERGEATYNYAEHGGTMTELPGVSVFFKDESGSIYHTYSCYARGLDMLNTAYHYLDLVPKGRDEGSLPSPMAWVRLHDEYGT